LDPVPWGVKRYYNEKGGRGIRKRSKSKCVAKPEIPKVVEKKRLPDPGRTKKKTRAVLLSRGHLRLEGFLK